MLLVLLRVRYYSLDLGLSHLVLIGPVGHGRSWRSGGRCPVGQPVSRSVSRPAGRSTEGGGRPPHSPLLALTYGEGDIQEVGE